MHETEALKPSDPVPKNYTSIPPKPQRLKLIVNSKPRSQAEANEDTEIDEEATIYNPDDDTEALTTIPFTYPPDVQLTEEEISMPPDQLFRLLRRQCHWSETDGVDLREEVTALEAKKREEWLEKELVLANVMEAELANAHDKGEPPENIQAHLMDLPQPILPMDGPQPWYRIRVEPEEQRVHVPPGEKMQVDQRIPVHGQVHVPVPQDKITLPRSPG